MENRIVDALTGETLIHENALAAVTTNCAVVRDTTGGARVVVSIETITGLKKVTTTKPGLLVISSGLFTIAAASYVSKQGLTVAIPIAFIASLFVTGYVGTRRAAVLFLMKSGNIESVMGSFREATAVIRAVQQVRRGDLSEWRETSDSFEGSGT